MHSESLINSLPEQTHKNLYQPSTDGTNTQPTCIILEYKLSIIITMNMNISLHIFPFIHLLFLFYFQLSLIFKFTQKMGKKNDSKLALIENLVRGLGASRHTGIYLYFPHCSSTRHVGCGHGANVCSGHTDTRSLSVQHTALADIHGDTLEIMSNGN